MEGIKEGWYQRGEGSSQDPGELVTASRVFIIGVLDSRAASATICLTLGYARLKMSLDQIISLVSYIPMIKFVFLLHFSKQNFLWFFSV